MPPIPLFQMSQLLFYPFRIKIVGSFGAYIISQDSSDSKSNRLHVDDIFRFCFYSFEVYSFIDSSQMIGNSPQVSNFNRLFLLKLNQLFHL